MKKKAFLLSAALVLAAILPACTAQTERAGKPKVAATIFPLYDITRNLTGDIIEVELILPPGASPHTFELTPQRVERLQGASAIFRIGHGLDDWTENLAHLLIDDHMVVVDKGVHLIHADGQNHEEEGGHGHGGANPHYWLSVDNAEVIAGNIAETIIKLDPDNEESYRNNLRAYVQQLENLKRDIAQKLAPLEGGKLLTFHDAFVYYAREFNLQIVGTIEPFPGKQPTPRYLAGLQQKIQQHNIRALFTEPQLSRQSVEALAHDLGLRLYVLDPLGGVDGRDSYVALMTYNTNTIIEALSNGRR